MLQNQRSISKLLCKGIKLEKFKRFIKLCVEENKMVIKRAKIKTTTSKAFKVKHSRSPRL
jgi:transposase